MEPEKGAAHDGGLDAVVRAATETAAQADDGQRLVQEAQHRWEGDPPEAHSWAQDVTAAARLTAAGAQRVLAAAQEAAGVRTTERTHLQTLFAALPIGLVLADATAPDLPLTFANAAFLLLTGYTREEVLGRNCRFLQGPDTAPAARASLRQALTSGTGCTVVLRNYRRDGTAFWNEVTLAPLADADGTITQYVGLQADVSARVEAEGQHQQLRALLASTAEGLYGLDTTGLCTFINRAAATLLGYTPDELIGRDLHPLIHHHRRDGMSYPAAECPITQVLRTGQGVRVADEVVWTRAGVALPVEYAAEPVVEQGRVTGVVVAILDVSERVRAQQERADLLVREQAARAAAEAAVAQRDQLLALAAHDLRTPLTALLGRIQLQTRRLERGQVPSPQEWQAWLDLQRELLGRELAVVQEVTDAAQLHLGEHLDLHRAPFDLSALIREVVAVLAGGQGGGTARPPIAIVAPAPVEIVGDRVRLGRVLQNVIGNAVKYSPQGQPVQVEVLEAGTDAVVVVQDAGVGIPADEVARVFEPFYRATTAQGIVGTGLGLAGSRVIVAEHGGTITLQSTLGVGTTVTLSLPRGGPA